MPAQNDGKRGYAFLILMMMVTILLISLTAALPSIYTEGQREKEEELIFRGNEYARAILFFHNQFGRYPSNVNELVKKTNGYRFLRHAYRDPMTPNGTWRFIHANAAGMVLDSKTMTLPTATNNNNGLNPPGQLNNQLQQPGQSNMNGLNLSGQQNLQALQAGQTNTNEMNSSDQQNGEPSPSSQNSDSETGESKTGESTSSGGQMLGAFIVGVASTSHSSSIRIYNNKTRYDEWEFLAVGQGVGSLLAPVGTTGGQTPPIGGFGQSPGQTPGIGPGGLQGGAGVSPPPVQPQNPE
ncbi:MAG TPA: hypothetical protein VG028_00675 [Terriglobia bacterium]|nr:hypothetical protein [Terriglobia bacterium]